MSDRSFKNQKTGSVYYNLRLSTVNDDIDGTVPLSYNIKTRGQNIVDKSSDYFISVNRFKISNTEIPLMRYFGTNDTRHYAENNGLGDDNYYCIFKYNGDEFKSDPLPDNYILYSYTDIARFFQLFIDNAFNKLITAYPILNTVKIPTKSFNISNGLYIIKFEETFQLNNITFFTNDTWGFKFFYGGKAFTHSNTLKVFQVDIPQVDTPAPNNYVEVSQDIDTRQIIDEIDEILFLSYKIPVRAELLQKSGQTQRILTDFQPPQTIGRGGYYQFSPLGRQRKYTLENKLPLREIDVSVFWSSVYNDLNQLTVPPTSVNTIKLEFSKETF